ncbi:major facilitator superfamily domain-containing protein [Phthorimaea operculella]|nr:major facilitator superfamily domain-containing protein [Phthorimaea operculella]
MVKSESSAEKKYAEVLAELECNNEHQEQDISYGYGVRHLQMSIIFISLCVTFIARAQINASIVAMTDVKANITHKEANITLNNTNFELNENTTYEDMPQDEYFLQEDHVLDDKNITYNDTDANKTEIKGPDLEDNFWDANRVYAWPKSTQEMVLGSFFLGYMIMMSPIGLVCQRWGGKLPLQISLFASGIITFCTPWLALIGDYKAVCMTRVAVGLCQAGTYPAVHTLLAKWIPVNERAKLTSYVYAGPMIGTILAYHVSGFLSVSRHGWPSIFWLAGILCILMGFLLTWMVAPSPQQHKSISEKEKNYILGGVKDQTEKRYPTPWKAIMTSIPVWACFIAHVGTGTVFVFMFTQIPTYLHHGAGLDLKSSGLASSLPYVANFFVSIFIGMASEYCIDKKYLSTKSVRILSNCLATVGPAIGLFSVTFVHNATFAVCCMTLSTAVMAGTHTGWMVNYIDLSPNFSGTLMATGNTLMNLSAVLLPILVSNVVRDLTNLLQWRIIVFTVGTIGLVTNVIYYIFISVEVQPWNSPEYELTGQDEPDSHEEKANVKNEDDDERSDIDIDREMSKTLTSDIKKTDNQNVNIADSDFKVSKYGYRHQQCLIMFIYLTVAYSMRACIGVAVVAMMESHPVELNQTMHFNDNKTTFVGNDTSLYNDTNLERNNDTKLYFKISSNESDSNGSLLGALLLEPPYPKFNWSHNIQGVVMSSFFWGYMLLQIPAGQLVHKFGAKYLLVGALAINCVVSFCFPWAAHYGGWIAAVACRMAQGLSQAFIFPGVYAFFGQWSPLEERSRLVGFAQGGQAVGTVLGLPITGFIAASLLGWPGIFRFYGILSGLVAVLVYFMVFDTPSLHPKISFAEKRYIEDGLGIKEGQKKKKRPVPWGKILRCRALYLIALSHISTTWGQITLFTEIPAFMAKVMHENIKNNSLLTALPFAVMWFTNFFFNWFIDWIIENKYLSLTNARKLANSLGCIPAAIGLVTLAYAPKNIIVVEAILIFICSFTIATHVGSLVTHIDIAPNFAGTMMSISNFCSNLVGSQAPLAVAYFVTDETSEYQWRNVFFLAAGLYFFANLIYCLFGTAEKAPWNDPDDGDDAEDAPEMIPMIAQINKRKYSLVDP